MPQKLLRLAFSHAAVVCSLSFFVLMAGCSSKGDERMQVYPTSGVVKVNGQPVSGVVVALFSATPEMSGPGIVSPHGQTDEYGVFRLTSYEPDDGAPVGTFKVTAFWPEPTPDNAGEMFQPKDRLKGKYSNPDGSGLTVDVPEGGGELPLLELK